MRCAERWLAISLFSVLFASFLYAGVGDGSWLKKVPARDRTRLNPFMSDPAAIAAGAKLFTQHCAACHGKNAEGKDEKPSLRSERLRQTQPGEVQWLLKNGSLKNGMPSWARLPEEQRWQIITYLKSIQ